MDTVTAEKETGIRRYRRIRTIGRMLRCLEACIALLVLSWSSARLPVAARTSGHFLRAFAAVLLSPRFVFLLGNAIVLVLFAKSGHLSTCSAAAATGGGDLYDEFIESRDTSVSLPPPTAEARDEVCADKEVSPSSGTGQRAPDHQQPELEVGLKGCEGKPPAPEGSESEEREMSAVEAEEFRRTVESFIAKQLRFQREESMKIVSSAGPPEAEILIY